MIDATLRRLLEDLCRRIDEGEEARVHQAWRDFLDLKLSEGVFVPPRRTPRPPGVEWPQVHINDAVLDPRLTVISQFAGVSDVLAKGGNGVLNVRCNYGVGIMTSQLGCEVVIMPREQGNLPITTPLSGERAIERAIERGVPPLTAGQGEIVFRTAELFLEIFREYPLLGRWVELYHPDTQGPMDNADLAWGSDIFLAVVDEPAKVAAFLDLMTEHYIAFMRAWFQLVPPRPSPYIAHWGMLFKGRIVLRDDSLMNLSNDVYVSLIRDREARCLHELGGGAIHFCGRGDHFIGSMCDIPELTAINMSQPHLNDMDVVFRNTIDRGKVLVGFDQHYARDKVTRPLRGRVHCWEA